MESDNNLLESSLMAPLATYGGIDLYPDILTKVAALLYGITNSHPFIDGNKRMAFVVAITVLQSNGHTCKATQNDVVHVMLNIARGEIGIPAITAWLEDHT